MNNETWLTADDALEKGFVDEIEQEKKLAASIEGGFLMLNNQKFDLERYKNKPKIEAIEPEKENETLEEKIKNEKRGESEPLSDKQKQQLYSIRKKLNTSI